MFPRRFYKTDLIELFRLRGIGYATFNYKVIILDTGIWGLMHISHQYISFFKCCLEKNII